MRRLTALEAFRSTRHRYPDRVALEPLDGRELTYAALDRRTDALAGALDDRLGDGRLAVVAETRPEAVETILAAMKRGRANVQLPTRGEVGGLAAMIETTDARGLAFDAATAEQARGVADRVDLDALVGMGEVADRVDGAVAYDALLENPDLEAGPDEPQASIEVAVFFTSGTTSAPKAVVADQVQFWLAGLQPALEMSLTATDRAMVCTPWYHGVTAMAWLMAHFVVGARAVLQPRFEPSETLRAMAAHRTTGLLAVPTQLEALLEAKADLEVDLSALSYLRTGGAVVPETLIDRVRDELTEGVFNTYGQTEAVVNLSFAYPAEQDDHPGTIGTGTFTWELRAVEPADPAEAPDPEATVAAGETGEILARGPRMIDGYVDRPEETAGLFVDGWLRTGDVARVDADGHLVVIDRIDNMLVSGGENIYPEEVQRALKDHPAVRDAGVVGLPDDRWGELVAAAVVADPEVTEDDLEAHCRAHDTLADFKRPRRYVLLPPDAELPRTATGTLRRGEVEAMFDDAADG